MSITWRPVVVRDLATILTETQIQAIEQLRLVDVQGPPEVALSNALGIRMEPVPAPAEKEAALEPSGPSCGRAL